MPVPYGHNQTTTNRQAWQVRESVLVPAPNNQGRVDFDPSKFDIALQQKGIRVKIYRTTYCPKVKSVDGAEHEINCTLCNGSGWLDVDPICDVTALIYNQELDKLPQVEGFVDGNTVKMTFPVGIELQYFTKIEFQDFTEIFMQRLMRAPGTLVDVTKYNAKRVNVLIDYFGIRYYQDRDFMIDCDGNIRWLTPGDQRKLTFGTVPDAGSFTITWNSMTTAPILFSAAASDVQTALRALTGLGALTVTGNFSTGFVVTNVGVPVPVALFTTTSSLTASSNPVSINVTDVSVAARKPNDNVPYTLHYETAVQFRAVLADHVCRFTQLTANSQVEMIKMPESWYCKKEFLVKRRDHAGNEMFQGPYNDHVDVVEPRPDDSIA